MKDSVETRELTIDDFDLIEQLYLSINCIMHVPVPKSYFQNSLEIVKSEYLNSNNRDKLLFGTFLNNQLILSMGIYFWPTQPNCSFLRLLGRTTSSMPRSLLVDIFRSLYGTCLDELEVRNYFRFYVLSAKRHHRMMAELCGTWDRLSRNYYITVEEIIPPNSTPRFPYVWDMMGKQTWPTEIIVRAGTLVNSARKGIADHIHPRAWSIWNNTGD